MVNFIIKKFVGISIVIHLSNSILLHFVHLCLHDGITKHSICHILLYMDNASQMHIVVNINEQNVTILLISCEIW